MNIYLAICDVYFLTSFCFVPHISRIMAGKVVLHYLNGRGKMESVRWLLTVAEVEVRERHGQSKTLLLLNIKPIYLNVICIFSLMRCM